MTAVDPVVGKVLRLANEVHGLARKANREDVRAPLAEQAVRWKESVTTVVLAGAQKRGKSRLLNTLVGCPDLLPVDVDIATHTQVAVRRGEAVKVTVHRNGPAGPIETEIERADLPRYASVLGDPAVLREVTGIVVTLPEPQLEGLCLIDTPGVDSLTLGHRHATMAALTRADVLLFAVSAQDQPVLRHELEFLAEAADRIQSIAFVLTKVEDATSWRELLVENRARLARFAGPAGHGLNPAVAKRLLAAPWLPVSAKLGDAAAELEAAGHADRAKARLDRSGLPALRDHIGRLRGRRDLVRAGGVLTSTMTGLRALADTQEDRVAGGTGIADGLALRRTIVEYEIEELAALKRQRRKRSIDHQMLGRGVTNRARAKLESYRRTYEKEVAELHKPAAINKYTEGLPESIERTLAAAWSEIAADVERTVNAALPRYISEMGANPADMDRVAMQGPNRMRRDMSVDAAGPGFDLVGEGLPAMMMAGALGMMSYTGFGLAALGIPILAPIAVGGLLAVTLTRSRRKVAEATRNRTALTKTLVDVFTVAANDMCLSAEQAVAAWRGNADEAIDIAFAARQSELDTRRKELATLAAKDTAERNRMAAAAAAALRPITEATEKATELGKELTEAMRKADLGEAAPRLPA